MVHPLSHVVSKDAEQWDVPSGWRCLGCTQAELGTTFSVAGVGTACWPTLWFPQHVRTGTLSTAVRTALSHPDRWVSAPNSTWRISGQPGGWNGGWVGCPERHCFRLFIDYRLINIAKFPKDTLIDPSFRFSWTAVLTVATGGCGAIFTC